MKRFEEFESGFDSMFDKAIPLVNKKGVIQTGSFAGLPVVYKDGIAGADLFGRWASAEPKKKSQ